MRIIGASIDLSKVDKSKIIEGKNGAKYYNFTILVNDEPDKFGKDVSLVKEQSKEQRANKEKKEYIGNGKTVWKSEPNVTSEKQEPYQNRNGIVTPTDTDLPF
jgi:hypothetical protein